MKLSKKYFSFISLNDAPFIVFKMKKIMHILAYKKFRQEFLYLKFSPIPQ